MGKSKSLKSAVLIDIGVSYDRAHLSGDQDGNSGA